MSHVDIPVVVVHAGAKSYVRSCLRKAVDSNPRGRVEILGDDATAAIGIGEHHRLDDPALQADITEFRAANAHHGPAEPHRFERFCIERWFVVRNFMRREGLDRCLVVDSDVLLFCDVAEEAARFGDAAMTFARWGPARLLPHCTFINGRDALESFCDDVLDVYRRPGRLEAVKAANAKNFGRHWVSDMSLFHTWAARRDFRAGMLEDTLRTGARYDDCIDRTADFARRAFLPGVLRAWKWIEYRDGVHHARHRRAGLVRQHAAADGERPGPREAVEQEREPSRVHERAAGEHHRADPRRASRVVDDGDAVRLGEPGSWGTVPAGPAAARAAASGG